MSEALAARRPPIYAEAHALVAGARRLVLTTHVQPDCDGIGSEVAFARWLLAQGKDAVIINPNPTPRRFQFLEEAAPVEGFEAARFETLLRAADLFVVLDTSVPERLGLLEPIVRRQAPPTLLIDHHVGPAGLPGTDIRETRAAATGEIVYRLLSSWGAEIDTPTATALYAAIAYDTGGFRYGNTRASSHEIAAELLRRGADIDIVRRQLFESITESRARLLARALSTYERSAGGRVAWVALSRATMQSVGSEPDDVDGVAEALRAIEGVEVAIVAREIRDAATKISFRSRGVDDVNAFALRFGGGGHRNAAGAYLEKPLNEVMAIIVPAARAAFDPAEG